MLAAFLMNLFLAVVYVLLTDRAGALNFMTGFGIGYIVVWLYGKATGGPSYAYKLWKLLRFAVWFMLILTKANLQIAWEIITPGMHQTPRILRFPVEGLGDVEITTLANCITLTPGTLVVDVSDDGHWMYIHCMYAEDRQRAIDEISELADRLHREVFLA